MTTKYARGRVSFGYCDTCGGRCDSSELKLQVVAGRLTNTKNCPECLDEDQPQYFIGRYPINDPQALWNPRPDTSQTASRALWGWDPVGNPAIQASGQVGVITLELNGIFSPITYSGDSESPSNFAGDDNASGL